MGSINDYETINEAVLKIWSENDGDNTFDIIKSSAVMDAVAV